VRRWRERVQPEPSSVWQSIAIVLASFAFAAALSALAAPSDSGELAIWLWVGAAVLGVFAATCLLAHWDVNRGRRSRQYETEELPLPGHD
jgi:formate-dependent nitrite reductase membrane component NrfD